MSRTNSLPSKGRDSALSFLNAAIEALNLANEISSTTPAKAVFGSVSILLTMIRDLMVNDQDYVELGLSCADVCQALDRGLKAGRPNELSESMLGAIGKLTTTVASIQNKIIKRGKRNPILRLLHVNSDKDAIAAWGRDLDRILHIFNTELSMNNHMMLLDLYRNALAGQEDTGNQHQVTSTSTPLGELPPPPPRACFGRDELIAKIISLADDLNPIALIGTGGIGKTSIALAVLHDDRIKKQFGDNRRFIRCNRFLPSKAGLLSQLSKTIGAGIENPEDLAPLRPALSSKKMVLVLDNGETILDPQGADGKSIYSVVEELGRFPNIYLIITSRIHTIPSDCETLEIPTLSMEAAHDAFYRIYKSGGRPDSVNNILQQLDFHPLSVTLLATVAHQNKWDNSRLVREWERRQTSVLQTEHDNSLAATIELSLSSPMFKELGPDARGLLGVVAFFPQGVDEDNLEWLFSTISNRDAIFNKFCVLSLAYRSNGFVTMLAPLRDHLRPEGPTQSLLLTTTKAHYFTRLSVELDPAAPGFSDGQWITSEDVNVEHLLDVFTSIDTYSDDVWRASANFMRHLYWNKPRQTVLKSKIERLPDDHHSKPRCLLELAWLFESLGNHAEQKRLSAYALKLNRERGDNNQVAETLDSLSEANRRLGLFTEGIEQAKECLAIHERLGNKVKQADCLIDLAYLLFDDEQFDTAKEAISRTIDLLEEGQEYQLCKSHRLLGDIYRSTGEPDEAIHHFEEALRTTSRFNWHDQAFWIHHSLARVFLGEDKLDDAHAHINQAKMYATDDTYRLGRATYVQATIWFRERRIEEAVSEALRAQEIYEKLGAVRDLGQCRALLCEIEEAVGSG